MTLEIQTEAISWHTLDVSLKCWILHWSNGNPIMDLSTGWIQRNTVVLWYSSLIHSGTRDGAKTDEYWMMKHFLLQGGVATHTHSSECDESWAKNAECWNIFFLMKMQWVQGWMSSVADRYWGMTVYEEMLCHYCGGFAWPKSCQIGGFKTMEEVIRPWRSHCQKERGQRRKRIGRNNW